MSRLSTDGRITTGSEQADEILGGGFPENSINIIMGQPGTGNTVFAEHLVFKNAGGDRPILYLTTISEPASKVLRYLQRFSFFDETLVGTAVVYEDIGPKLAQDGIKALLPVVREAILTISPKVIVVDSFKALHDLAPSLVEMRALLYELAGLFSAYAATLFLVGEYTDEELKRLPEFAVADGIIQLMRSALSTRDERFLRVVKLRGSRYLEGLHGFKITADGLEIYPRLVTPEAPKDYVVTEERLPSGIDGLDNLLDGGLRAGSATLLAGPAGAGKTTMGLQFALEGLAHGEQSLFVNFQENPTQLARSIRSLGADPDRAQANGLHLMYVSPVELQIDSVIVALFREVREGKIRRVVLDSIGDLVAGERSEAAPRLSLRPHSALCGEPSHQPAYV